MRIRDEGNKGLSEGGQQNPSCPLNITPTKNDYQPTLIIDDFRYEESVTYASPAWPCVGNG